ncbi:MAG: PilZ domain-containing protein [Magnetococcales bacterium]|nr:PilZ domain-containing protein [Magnetococcales bacterium]
MTEKRAYYRHCLQRPLTLVFDGGERIDATTRDVSMDGLFVECRLENHEAWAARRGQVSIPFRDRIRTFDFEVVRVLSDGVGLQITNHLGMFGRILVEGVFGEVF